MKQSKIQVSEEDLGSFCRKWKIAELALFGSILREDFGAESDVDVMARFSPDAEWSLLDHVRMEDDLRRLFGREVDLVSRRAIEQSSNPIRRRHILDSAKVWYAA